MSKRLVLAAVFGLSVGLLAGCSKTQADTKAGAIAMTVYKSPTCGCCTLWVQHVEQNGIVVKTKETTNVMPLKQKLDVPPRLASCHTGVVGGYVVEGHVPADVIHRLLKELPPVAGIAVAGMPLGSPGMESSNPEPYDIIAFTAEGQEYVFASR